MKLVESYNDQFVHSFGEIITYRRKSLGLSQKDLAAMADVVASTVSKIEKNQNFPSAGMLAKLAGPLKVEATELLLYQAMEAVAKEKDETFKLRKSDLFTGAVAETVQSYSAPEGMHSNSKAAEPLAQPFEVDLMNLLGNFPKGTRFKVGAHSASLAEIQFMFDKHFQAKKHSAKKTGQLAALDAAVAMSAFGEAFTEAFTRTLEELGINIAELSPSERAEIYKFVKKA